MPTLMRHPGFGRRIAWIFLLVLLGLSWAGAGLAHERWVLTPEQIAEWNTHAKPAHYTAATFLDFSIIAGFAVFTVAWIRLGFTGARELFPGLQARLGAYGDAVAPVLRVCLAWVLLSSALGLEPRLGVERFASPTLFAPDLELAAFGPGWLGLRWLEVGLAVGFLLGVYVRVCAGLLLFLSVLGLALFAADILAYFGALAGVGIYLLLQGPGSHYIPMPTHPAFRAWQAQLAAQPRQRAQAIMRVLTGLNIFYLAVVYKVFQPNLSVAILSLNDVPLLSAAPETFTLVMTLVELTAGLLMVVGVLLRPLSLFFLFAFLFFAALLPESWMAHALFYGVMLSFLFNGAGHFHMPEAKDKPAHIVVVGGTFAAIHAAMKMEKLIGQYSHVRLTLVHRQPNVLFYPLLPEVIGGTMQPGNAVNPIRRVLPRTRVLLGELAGVDSVNRRLHIAQADKTLELDYDELILALFPVPNLTGLPGLLAHGNPINSVGDALHIRKRIMDLVEQAELTDDAAERARLLSFAVIGAGQRACATAVEIGQILETAKTAYPVLRDHGWTVRLYEDSRSWFSAFEDAIKPQRDRALEKAGVSLIHGRTVAALTRDALVLDDGSREPVGLVVNATFMLPSVMLDGQSQRWPLDTEDDLRVKNHPHIWAAAAGWHSAQREFLTVADWVSLGKTIGHNAWAASQGFPTHAYHAKTSWLKVYNMGRRSLCRAGPLLFGGTLAWLVSRTANIAALPGLERNLRILIDWTLDIPFRADIAVLAPDATAKLQRLHFEAGDEVIRQGDDGDCAYLVQSGQLQALRDGRVVGELGGGDCFGEIALVQDGPRTATVRCLTPCELTAISRDDFQSLAVGSSVMARAIRQQVEERILAQRV
ncbi:MAG: cyclic nucleotide-binding domain-containing protein [Candidatus Methylumidiphilus sp.]